MGVKCLNRYLTQQCQKTSIMKEHISCLKGQKIAIDTSIYLYKYRSQDALQESFYNMISLFRKYDIIPLFIFDGKPPPEKMDALKERKMLKLDAEKEYNVLQKSLEIIEDNGMKETILGEMELLKRQFVRISDRHVKSVKKIMDAYGVHYYDAFGEADRVCAYLCKEKCYGCMSDDMDMFVYGCPVVIRHLSLIHETVLIYYTNKILSDLAMPHALFKQISILSGTDYNIHDNDISLFETLKWFKEYNRTDRQNDENVEKGFYYWLRTHTKYVKNFESLEQIHSLYNMDISLPILDELVVCIQEKYNKRELEEIMKEHGFIFV
jgi:flap endonuclease-1